jgi:hypothetical protein
VILLLLSIFVIACFGVVYFVGDLAKYQEVISARDTQTALRGVNDPEQLSQALKQFPSNNILKLVALANKESIEIDAATQRLLSEAEPARLSKPIDLSASSRSDLDALGQDLKIAKNNVATFEPGYIAAIKAQRDKIENEAHSLNVGSDTIAKFMAVIDEQNADMTTLISKLVPARAEYYSALEKCAALLAREFGIYKVENGQFVFPFQSTANSYNRAAAAMAAAAKHIAELEAERATVRQSRLERWKTIADR